MGGVRSYVRSDAELELFFIAEYGGKWKILHYFAQHFFEPTLVSPFIDGNDINVYIVLDELPVKEIRDVHHKLHFQPKSNPRPFSLYDMETLLSNHATIDSPINQIPSRNLDEFSGTLYVDMFSWDNNQALYTWKVPFKVR